MNYAKINKKNRQMLRRTVLVSLLITFLLCIPNVTMMVKATDIIVDDDGTGDYTTIQDAIDNATAGDTIWVKAGSYNEQLTVNKDVTIIADTGATPIIYATTWVPSIDVTAVNVTIEGFKIYGNSGSGSGPTIRASSGSDGLKVRNNEFNAISGEIGNTALLITTSVEKVEFTSNTVTSYAVGVSLQDNSKITISGNSFSNVNYSVYHAALIQGTTLYHGSIQDAINEAAANNTIIVLDGTYTENVVVGTALTLESGSAPVINGQITINANFTYVNGLEITNPTGSNGISIGSGYRFVTLSNNIIRDITTGDPTGISVSVLSNNITIMGNFIYNISGTNYCHGVMLYGANDKISDIAILNNEIYNITNPNPASAYGITLHSYCEEILIEGNTIYNITAGGWSAGIVAWGTYLPVDVYAPAFITIDNNDIMNVTATAIGGAGIWFDDYANNATVTYNNIKNNTGGVVLNGYVNVTTVIVNINSITNNTGYGVYNNIGQDLDARFNFWGDISGPYNQTTNPTGTGDNVSENVTFWPWLEFDRYSIPPTVEYVVGMPKENGGLVISDSTEIAIIAEDNESGMLSITYRIWDTVHRWLEWKNYTGKITLSGEGKHMVQYNATDNAGTNNTETNIHYVDTMSPEVEVIYPNGGEFIYGSLPIQWTATDKILDQEQTQWNRSSPLSEDYPGHIQSFIPTEGTLNSVQLLLEGDDANISVKIFTNITPVPIPIAQSSQHLQFVGNPGYPVWIDFPFNSDINVDPGKTYYIGVTQEIYGNTGFNWYYFNSSGGADLYEYGHAWMKKVDELVNKSDCDWGFKTMYWENDIDITVEYSMSGVSPWSTIAEDEPNDGTYLWDTTQFPDGESYRIRIIAEDSIMNMGGDSSDGTFVVDNDGPSISNIVITDTTIESTEFTKDDDNLEITATIMGNPVNMTADLSALGKGSAVPATSYTGTTAKWEVGSITCSPSNGPINVRIDATDTTGDSSTNTGSIIADNKEPTLSITRPGPGLYIMDSMRLLPFSYPFIIGQITVIADVNDDEGSGISRVEFYLENDLEANATEAPYSWLWDRAATGFFDLEVKAYDNVGHTAIDEIKDLFIINLDIIGHQS
jgi:parallel beta-helix repeat protein